MKIMDEKGRLFGKLNIVDFLVLVLLVVVAAALLVMRNTHQGNHAAQHHADRQSNCRYIQRGDDPFEVLLPAV